MSNNDGSVNIFGMLGHVFYQVANTFTSMVGLTPFQFVAVVGCIIALVLLWSFVQAARGQTKFSLEDE